MGITYDSSTETFASKGVRRGSQLSSGVLRSLIEDHPATRKRREWEESCSVSDIGWLVAVQYLSKEKRPLQG